MAKIQEQRQKLEAKLKEMAEDGVMKTPPKETVSFDPPDEEYEEEVKTEVSTNQKEKQNLVKELMPTSEDKQEKTLCKSHERGNEGSAETPRTSLEDYRTRYLQSIRLRERTNFTMSADTLQVLRNILQDLGERVSMACYIDNILREHLKEHKELLNNATAKHRRKVAIDF
jgi:putative conjugative transposon protein traC